MPRIFQPENEAEKPLTGTLAEFRTALREEIDAASRNASANGISLLNGRRIGQIGNGFQYVFEIENALNLPGDAPGDLHLPGHPPIEVAVVSTEGMAITLNIWQDLGAFVPHARLQTNLAFLMRKLIERIEALANTPNPTGDRVLGRLSVSGEPLSATASGLNSEQAEALASSLGRNLTFIWGPPGTGKSTTIGKIGAELHCRKRAVLLVSHTNAAVDQALLRLSQSVDPADLEAGRVLRVGQPKDYRISDKKELLLATHVERRSEELLGQKAAIEAELASLVSKATRVSRSIELCEWVREAQNDIESMQTQVRALQASNSTLERLKTEHVKLTATSAWWVEAETTARKTLSCLEEMPKWEKRCSELAKLRATFQTAHDRIHAQRAEARQVYDEASATGWLVRRWRGLPSPEDQQKVVDRLSEQLAQSQQKMEAAQVELEQDEQVVTSLVDLLEQFRNKYSAHPNEILRQANDRATRVAQLLEQQSELSLHCARTRKDLQTLLHQRLLLLAEWGLAGACSGSAEDMLVAITTAYENAAKATRDCDLRDCK